jgi:hypothetical protein
MRSDDEPTEPVRKPPGRLGRAVRRANAWVGGSQSAALGWICWVAIAVELAYASHYVRVMHKVAPVVEVGEGCATFCCGDAKP